MKKRILFFLMVLAAGALACRALPLNLPGSFQPTATPPSSVEGGTPVGGATPPAPTHLPSLEEGTPQSTPQPPVDFNDQVSTEAVTADQYSLKLRYPQLDVVQANSAPGFNQAVKEMVDGWVAQFRQDAAGMVGQMPGSNGSFLGIDYKVFYNQSGLISLQFSLDTYIQGAAHPNQVSYPLSYDLGTGQRIELKDLFQPDSNYLAVISALCVADLQKRDFPLTQSGVAPTAENYRSWNLTPGALRITFDAYQVAAYAAGPQTVEIPWKALGPLLSPAYKILFLP